MGWAEVSGFWFFVSGWGKADLFGIDRWGVVLKRIFLGDRAIRLVFDVDSQGVPIRKNN
jgi:hypothetical protein